jgi:hypothetical protein
MRSKSLKARIAWLFPDVRASGLPLPHHNRCDHDQRGQHEQHNPRGPAMLRTITVAACFELSPPKSIEPLDPDDFIINMSLFLE